MPHTQRRAPVLSLGRRREQKRRHIYMPPEIVEGPMSLAGFLYLSSSGGHLREMHCQRYGGYRRGVYITNR